MPTLRRILAGSVLALVFGIMLRASNALFNHTFGSGFGLYRSIRTWSNGIVIVSFSVAATCLIAAVIRAASSIDYRLAFGHLRASSKRHPVVSLFALFFVIVFGLTGAIWYGHSKTRQFTEADIVKGKSAADSSTPP